MNVIGSVPVRRGCLCRHNNSPRQRDTKKGATETCSISVSEDAAWHYRSIVIWAHGWVMSVITSPCTSFRTSHVHESLVINNTVTLSASPQSFMIRRNCLLGWGFGRRRFGRFRPLPYLKIHGCPIIKCTKWWLGALQSLPMGCSWHFSSTQMGVLKSDLRQVSTKIGNTSWRGAWVFSTTKRCLLDPSHYIV